MSQPMAVITDIHANLPALQVVLQEIESAGIETVYCLGDVIGICPHPAECLDLLFDRPTTHFIMGNHDAWFAFGLPTVLPESMSEGERAHHQWTHSQLDPYLREEIARWPLAITADLGGVTATFFHYALTSGSREFAPIIADASGDDLDRLFCIDHSEVLFFGHHHPVADTAGRMRYINPGSLGCSRESVARYVTVSLTPDGVIEVDFRSAPYDRTGLFLDFVERGVPERDLILQAFFDHNLAD